MAHRFGIECEWALALRMASGLVRSSGAVGLWFGVSGGSH